MTMTSDRAYQILEYGNSLYESISRELDKKVVEEALQRTIDHYWAENCEGEVPPNIEVSEITADKITFYVHEEDNLWSFSVPI